MPAWWCLLAPCRGHSIGVGSPGVCAWVASAGKWGRKRVSSAAKWDATRHRHWRSLPLPPGHPAPACPHIVDAAPGPSVPRGGGAFARPAPLSRAPAGAPRPAAARDAGRAAPAGRRRRRRQPASERHGGGGGTRGGPGGARAHAELRAASAAQLGQRGGGGAGLRGLRLGAGAAGPERARAPGASRAAAAGARRARLDRAALSGHHAPLSGQCGWGPGLGLGDPGPLCTPFCLCKRGHRAWGPRAVGTPDAGSWAAPRPFLSVRDGGGDGCGGVAGRGNPQCWVPDTGGLRGVRDVGEPEHDPFRSVRDRRPLCIGSVCVWNLRAM